MISIMTNDMQNFQIQYLPTFSVSWISKFFFTNSSVFGAVMRITWKLHFVVLQVIRCCYLLLVVVRTRFVNSFANSSTSHLNTLPFSSYIQMDSLSLISIDILPYLYVQSIPPSWVGAIPGSTIVPSRSLTWDEM